MPRYTGPALVVRTPRGRLEHPVDSDSLCTVIRRLAPFVPSGTWHVDPGNLTTVTTPAAQEAHPS